MKRVALILAIIFIILTFVGAIYILTNDGEVNAGYAVVPLIFALVFTALSREKRSDF